MEDNTVFFSKKNYITILIGIIVIALGYLLMIGGKNPTPEIFDGKELFSFRRMVISPVLILSGFGVIGFGILKDFRKKV